MASSILASRNAPYVLGLAERGYRIHLLMTQKAGQEALIADSRRLGCSPIKMASSWHVAYRSSPMPRWATWTIS
jgi:hypothetical protein